MVTKAIWEDGALDPKKIMLDHKNPRVEIDPSASQGEIRLKLLLLEEVLDLARKIDKNRGLFYGERIITVVENSKYVVLEGNRRVAACQMLLDPKLVPKAFATRFPLATPATKTAIRKIPTDIAPNRLAAEPILTTRHTERGPKPWSPVAKMRRAVGLLDSMTVEEVAQIQGTSASQIKKLIRPFKLLKYALSLNVWTDDERKVLENEKLKPNPYTRFFTLAETKNVLNIHFDADQNIVSALPEKVFRGQMERIARDFLLPDPANKNRPRFHTRTDPAEYFADFVSSKDGKAAMAAAALVPASTATAGRPSPTSQPKPTGAGNSVSSAPGATSPSPQPGATGSPRPSTKRSSLFFEHLECHVQNDILLKLTDELSRVQYRLMPIAASMLTRALLEQALVFKMKATDTWKTLQQQYEAQTKRRGGDPGLQDILKFCANFQNGVFAERNICRTLQSSSTTDAKDYLDAIAHMKYQEADPAKLESIANHLRQIIVHILAGN